MLRRYLMNNMLGRNLLLLGGYTTNYPAHQQGGFTPYFDFRIGKYQDDYLLYFPKLPKTQLYYNSIFLKLYAYNAHDAVKYITFHYNAYPDKLDFLLFLQRELQHRLETYLNNGKGSDIARWRSLSKIGLQWAEDKINEIKDRQKIQVYNQFIKNDLTVIIKNELQNSTHDYSAVSNDSINELTRQITENLKYKLDAIVETTGNHLEQLTGQYETGDIELVNYQLKDKLIGLFICLKNLTFKPRAKKTGETPLFSKIGLGDIAKLLRLNIVPFKGYKADTVEKSVYAVNNSYNSEDTANKELDKALQKFFYNH